MLVGLAGGVALDALLGDPRRGHPVAAFGRLASGLERVMHGDSRVRGTAYTTVLVAGAAGLGHAAARAAAPSAAATTAVAAAATWSVLGGTTLRVEAEVMAGLLGTQDLAAARERLSHLCGRDPAGMDVGPLARATVESVAENTSDAVVAPLLWGAIAGVPGLLAYRAANTLDAMVGHRSPRYDRFGWASARLDDLLNLVPARLTAALTAGLAPSVGGRAVDAARVWRRDGRQHPSPNAGPVEAAFAGALGRTLGGPLSYAGRSEDRPLLGDGPVPTVADIARARKLSGAVQAAALVCCLTCRGLAAGRRLRRLRQLP